MCSVWGIIIEMMSGIALSYLMTAAAAVAGQGCLAILQLHIILGKRNVKRKFWHFQIIHWTSLPDQQCATLSVAAFEWLPFAVALCFVGARWCICLQTFHCRDHTCHMLILGFWIYFVGFCSLNNRRHLVGLQITSWYSACAVILVLLEEACHM